MTRLSQQESCASETPANVRGGLFPRDLPRPAEPTRGLAARAHPGARPRSRDPGQGTALPPPRPARPGGRPENTDSRSEPTCPPVHRDRGHGDGRPPPSPSGAPRSRRGPSTSGSAATSRPERPPRACALAAAPRGCPRNSPLARPGSPGKQPHDRKAGAPHPEGPGGGWAGRRAVTTAAFTELLA